MTISSTNNRVVITGNGVATAFAYPYPFHTDSDLVVVSTVIATGVATVQNIPTHYSVSGTQDAQGHFPDGGSVDFVSAPAGTVDITIYRDPALVQDLDLVDNDGLPAESVESALDYMVMLIQRLDDLVFRSLRQPDGDGDAISELPSAVDRALKYLIFDSAGHPTAASTVTIGAIIVSAFMETVLTAANAAAARTTLGAPATGLVTASGLTQTTGTLLGRTTATTGAVEEITPGATLTLTAGGLSVAAASQANVDAGTADKVLTAALKKIGLLVIQATTSGTVFDFTIPSGVRRVTVSLQGVSLSGTDNLLVKIGASIGVVSSGYLSSSAAIAAAGTTVAASTAGFIIKSGVAANVFSGILTLELHNNASPSAPVWVSSHSLKSSTTVLAFGGGECAGIATGELAVVRLMTDGADTFDAGSVSVRFER